MQDSIQKMGVDKMKVRIQPQEIAVCKENPFKDDLLGRRESVEILSNLIANFDGPCILAMDAIWGAGKSTFLKMWAQHLRKYNFPVVEFNAWETDFSGDPFLALSAELTEGLGKYDQSLKPKLQKIWKAVTAVANSATRVSPQLLASMILIPGVGAIAEKGMDALLKSHFDKTLNEYSQAKKSLQEFRDVLKSTAKSLSQSKDGHPLVIVIDELDRCRPPYAVALLEIVKHLFSVDHVVFVLAINRDQLANSIKGLYGNDFDAKGYLERFFDLGFRLPDDDIDNRIPRPTQGRAGFIRAKLRKVPFARNAGDCQMFLEYFFRSDALSLREIERAILHLGLVFASIPEKNPPLIPIITVLLIVRTLDRDIYHCFIRKQISDQKVADEILERAGLQRVPANGGFHPTISFEAAIIVGPHERKISDNREDWSSPLLKWHREKAKDTNPDEESKNYAKAVVKRVQALMEQCRKSQILMEGGLGFEDSIRRLELLSPEFMEEGAEFANS